MSSVQPIPYGEHVDVNGVRVSLHPAGHILGSAQDRLEHEGEVWVVTGDYKTDPDVTCRSFELVPCHTLITECTFGLPVYRWPKPEDVFRRINAWWKRNQDVGKTSVLFGYALGKAQRLIGGLDPDVGPIFTHGAVERLTAVYRRLRRYPPLIPPQVRRGRPISTHAATAYGQGSGRRRQARDAP